MCLSCWRAAGRHCPYFRTKGRGPMVYTPYSLPTRSQLNCFFLHPVLSAEKLNQGQESIPSSCPGLPHQQQHVLISGSSGMNWSVLSPGPCFGLFLPGLASESDSLLPFPLSQPEGRASLSPRCLSFCQTRVFLASQQSG